MRLGLDYGWTQISPAAHKAVGSSFACRYLSPDGSKNLTPGEAHTLRSHGIDVVVVWESTADRSLAGRQAGINDAHTALNQAKACGIPAGRPIYFAVDFDETPGQAGQVAEYFRGVNTVLGVHLTGCYGGYWPVKRLFDAGLIGYGWQTYAWSGGAIDGRAQLFQYSNGHRVAGQDCDFNRSLRDDFGQWGYQAPKPPKAKPAAKHPTGTAYAGIGIDFDNGKWAVRPAPGNIELGSQDRWWEAKVAIHETTGEWRVTSLPFNK